MAFCFKGEYLKSKKIPESIIKSINPVSFSYIKTLGYEHRAYKLETFNNCFVTFITCRNISKKYPYYISSGGSSFSFQESVNSATLELIQTTISLATSTNKYLNWIESGKQMSHLDHNMYYFASPIHGDEASRFMWDFWEKLEEVYFYKNLVGSLDNLIQELNNKKFNIYFANVTPSPFLKEICIIKVLSNNFIPLVISEGHGPFEIIKSPNRIPFPHPFP